MISQVIGLSVSHMVGLDWTEETETSGKQVPGVRRQEMKPGERRLLFLLEKKVSIPRDEIYGVNFLRRNLIFYNLLENVGVKTWKERSQQLLLECTPLWSALWSH